MNEEEIKQNKVKITKEMLADYEKIRKEYQDALVKYAENMGKHFAGISPEEKRAAEQQLEDIHRTLLEYKKALKIYDDEIEEGREEPQFFQDAREAFARKDFYTLADMFLKKNSLYYDRAGIWWRYNGNHWEMTDETDIHFLILTTLNIDDVLRTSYKGNLMTYIQTLARRDAPKEPPLNWILTASGVYDIKSHKKIPANRDWFFQNYIPWKIGKSEETPTIDKLFEQWVGKDKKQQLYELVAYSLYRDYPIQRIFFLYGTGSNGKGSFVRFLKRFLGVDNISSFSFSRLQYDKFQTTKFYKKLVAIATEMEYNIIQKTSTMKSLVGGDLIPIEFKNKQPFDFINYSKVIVSTNSLPPTTDKTIGFYRRALIIEFPNFFKDGKEIIDEIPDEEYENLLKKSLRILEELLERGKFSNEGSIEDKRKEYEKRSNPVPVFLEETCVFKSGEFIPLMEFKPRFLAFCVQHGYRRYTRNEITGMLGEVPGIEKVKRQVEITDQYGNKIKRYLWGLDGIRWKSAAETEKSSKSSSTSLTLFGGKSSLSSIRDSILKELDDGEPKDITYFFTMLDFPEDKIREAIKELERENEIFEPKPGVIKKL